MSYDAYMQIDTGGSEPATVADIGNMTSNVSGMWTVALGGVALRDLEGKSGAELAPLLDRAVSHMHSWPALYKAMNPPNGWGSYESAREFLEAIRDACREHPKALLHLST